MKEILQEVYDLKGKYRECQLEFYKIFNQRYKTLLNKQYTSMIKNLEREMKYLLASSVIYKTGRVEINASPRYSYSNSRKEPVFIEQRPLVHYKHSSNDDINFFDEENDINKNDDLTRKESSSKKHTPYVYLSELRNFPKAIDQVKLDIFFKYLREIMIFKKTIWPCFDQEYRYHRNNNLEAYKKDESNTQVGSIFIDINDKSFHLAKISEGSLDENIEAGELMNFRGDANDRKDPEYSNHYQRMVGLMIEHYDPLIATLDKIEANKKKLRQTTDTFLAGIQQYTIPFKVAQKLKD
jgi:hypothetical protein